MTAPFRPRVHLRDAGAAAIVLDLHDGQEVLHLLRQRPEAVGQLGGEVLEIRALMQARKRR